MKVSDGVKSGSADRGASVSLSAQRYGVGVDPMCVRGIPNAADGDELPLRKMALLWACQEGCQGPLNTSQQIVARKWFEDVILDLDSHRLTDTARIDDSRQEDHRDVLPVGGGSDRFQNSDAVDKR